MATVFSAPNSVFSTDGSFKGVGVGGWGRTPTSIACSEPVGGSISAPKCHSWGGGANSCVNSVFRTNEWGRVSVFLGV